MHKSCESLMDILMCGHTHPIIKCVITIFTAIFKTSHDNYLTLLVLVYSLESTDYLFFTPRSESKEKLLKTVIPSVKTVSTI